MAPVGRKMPSTVVGDTVPYKITIEVPKNIEKLSTFTVTDTPTGLKDNVGSIKIKDNTTALMSGTVIRLQPKAQMDSKLHSNSIPPQ